MQEGENPPVGLSFAPSRTMRWRSMSWRDCPTKCWPGSTSWRWQMKGPWRRNAKTRLMRERKARQPALLTSFSRTDVERAKRAGAEKRPRPCPSTRGCTPCSGPFAEPSAAGSRLAGPHMLAAGHEQAVLGRRIEWLH